MHAALDPDKSKARLNTAAGATDTLVSTLANGVRVITINQPHLDSVCVSVFVRTGSAHESRRLNGISHVVEHMAFKGTATRDCQRINLDAERLAERGQDPLSFSHRTACEPL